MGSQRRAAAVVLVVVAAAMQSAPLNAVVESASRSTALATVVNAMRRWRGSAQTLDTNFASRSSALKHAPQFYDRATADAMFEEIAQFAGLNFTTYVVDGKRIQSPRQMMWCAEAGVGKYRFAANHVPGLKSHAFTPTLRRIRRDVEKAVGAPFNAVLINLYADGSEYSDWHSDDDPWLGQSFDVPSLSLGAARPFLTRRRGDGDATSTTLGPGSLLVLLGAFQREYEHSLPRVAGVGARINLTWRYIAPALRHLHNLKPRWDSAVPLSERIGDQRVPDGYFDETRRRDR